MYLIFSRHFVARSSQTYSRLIQLLVANGQEVGVWCGLYDQMKDEGFNELSAVRRIEDDADVRASQAVLSVGGDGTFLAAAKMVMGTSVPVLGINRGRLGFLSDVPPDKLHDAIRDLLAGNYRVINVPMLNMYADDARSPIGFAVNEFAVSKCDNSSMLTIEAYVDGDFLTTYWADGVIISTATGSTAYSLSVGGPIVHPSSPSIIITPVAPHNLTMRPLVLPDSVVLTLRIEGRAPNVMTSFDGQSHLLPCGGMLRIAKANTGVRRIQLRSYSFFEALRDKLLWGADMRNAASSLPSSNIPNNRNSQQDL